ncbi:MAG: signal recognition particle protein [Proteobacteria bacterium]|nr:signal recognition particle protein [Pseudomonadota bacterium]
MFDFLHNKIESALKKIRGRSSLSASDVEATMKEIRSALLEGDVNFKVAKDLCARITEKAIGSDILRSLSPDQQIIKLVHEELTATMGGAAAELDLRSSPPVVIMLVGLQGSGKTTTAAKLARLLKESYKRSPLLVPADVYRPAAIEQLKTLGAALSIPVFNSTVSDKPVDIAIRARDYAAKNLCDVIIIDTAGRLQIDTALMDELRQISAVMNPSETLLVADAMTGQESVNVAQGFDQTLSLSGLILTKLDGDARGGAALSMHAVTGKPIKFIGTGEKSDALEPFHPERMASRILGMGDVLTLIEKATQQVTLEDSLDLEKKFKKDQFTFEDFLNQMRMIKKMGSISSIASMIPGLNKIAKQIDPEKQEREFTRLEAIILSMTHQERRQHDIIDGSRRRRIAKGSGTTVEDVNKLLKQFVEMRKMMKQLMKMGPGAMAGLMGGQGLGGLGAMFGRRR